MSLQWLWGCTKSVGTARISLADRGTQNSTSNSASRAEGILYKSWCSPRKALFNVLGWDSQAHSPYTSFSLETICFEKHLSRKNTLLTKSFGDSSNGICLPQKTRSYHLCNSLGFSGMPHASRRLRVEYLNS